MYVAQLAHVWSGLNKIHSELKFWIWKTGWKMTTTVYWKNFWTGDGAPDLGKITHNGDERILEILPENNFSNNLIDGCSKSNFEHGSMLSDRSSLAEVFQSSWRFHLGQQIFVFGLNLKKLAVASDWLDRDDLNLPNYAAKFGELIRRSGESETIAVQG